MAGFKKHKKSSERNSDTSEIPLMALRSCPTMQRRVVSDEIQAVIVYRKDHYPTTPEELNFYAELQAASQWWCSDYYNEL